MAELPPPPPTPLLTQLLCLATLHPADYSEMASGVSSHADTQTLWHTHKHVGSSCRCPQCAAEWNMEGSYMMISLPQRLLAGFWQKMQAGEVTAWGLNIWFSSGGKKAKRKTPHTKAKMPSRMYTHAHTHMKNIPESFIFFYQMTTSCASDPWPCFTAAPWTPVRTQTPLGLHSC